MAENSAIEWTNHTFNPWIGCHKVSPGCSRCYAETLMDKRYGRVQWGPRGTRVRTGAANWRKPLAWNRKAEAEGRRYRVFCASLADVFEDKTDQPELDKWRADLFRLIQATPNLDWLLLTKRPERAWEWFAMLYQDEQAMDDVFDSDYDFMDWVEDFNQRNPIPNIWIGTSVENQATADERIPELLKIPARVRFLSCEPLLGAIDLREYGCPVPIWDGPYKMRCSLGGNGSECARHGKFIRKMPEGLHWVIIGGESGHNARPMHPDWARSLRGQCQEAGVPFFMKQWGELVASSQMPPDVYREWDYHHGTENRRDKDAPIWKVGKKAAGRLLDGREWSEFPQVEIYAANRRDAVAPSTEHQGRPFEENK